MAKNKSSKFGLADGFSFEEDNSSLENVTEINLSELHSFKNHPFKVEDDEKMAETVDSIREHGVLVPGIVRKRKEGGYEIISGHRRRRACEILGLETMPVFVRNMSDDEAIIIMVDSNIQREEILPSEKAKAYKMKYEAMKHQGRGKSEEGTSLEALSSETGDSISKIQRLIKVAELDDDFLEMIDEKKIGISQGVDIASLPKTEQTEIKDVIEEMTKYPSMAQTGEMKSLSEAGDLTKGQIRNILTEKEKVKKRKFVLNEKELSEFFPNESDDEIREVIIELLKNWKN